MARTVVLRLLFLFAAMVCAGCSPEPPLVPVEPERAATVTAVDDEMRAVVTGDNAFAVTLYRELASDSEAAPNLFFSPFSIATVLTMAAEGARGETAAEFSQVLGFQPADGHDLESPSPPSTSTGFIAAAAT